MMRVAAMYSLGFKGGEKLISRVEDSFVEPGRRNKKIMADVVQATRFRVKSKYIQERRHDKSLRG